MKSLLSFIFVMMAPFFLGGIMCVVAAKMIDESQSFLPILMIVYTVVYFFVWGVLLNGGRKLTI